MYESWVQSGRKVTGKRRYLAAGHPVDRPVVDAPHALRASLVQDTELTLGGGRLCCPSARHSMPSHPCEELHRDQGCIFIAMGNQGFPLES